MYINAIASRYLFLPPENYLYIDKYIMLIEKHHISSIGIKFKINIFLLGNINYRKK